MVGRPGHQTECLECGGDRDAQRAPGKEFCSKDCRTRFNNRRRVRGAALYDLKMGERFERDDATELNLLSKMNRLCAVWRSEDRDRRNGRRSWGDWRAWLIRNPWVGEGVHKAEYGGPRQRTERQMLKSVGKAMAALQAAVDRPTTAAEAAATAQGHLRHFIRQQQQSQ